MKQRKTPGQLIRSLLDILKHSLEYLKYKFTTGLPQLLTGGFEKCYCGNASYPGFENEYNTLL
jgi:hypothetical protein